MSSIGTFGSFTQARLGIYAAQKGLSVTGNNIANINTPGYTRQRLNQKSMYLNGADRYYSQNDVRIGNGVHCTSVSQLRDPYLDIRFRGKAAELGSLDAKLAGLQEIADILDEVGKGEESFGVIEAQFNDLYKKLQNLSDNTGNSHYDIQVRSSAEALVKKLNKYASQLEVAQKDAENRLDMEVKEVNRLLTAIRDLNTSIRKSEIHGDSSLELRDERNLLVDQLSNYIGINVTYTTEDIGAGQTVEKMIITLDNKNPDETVHTDESVLVDGTYATQFSFRQVPQLNPNFNDKLENSADNPQYLDSNGNPTHELDKAAMIEDSYLRMNLSELRDVNGKVLYNMNKQPETVVLDLPGKTAMEQYNEFVTDNNGNSKEEGPMGDGSFKITTMYIRDGQVYQREFFKVPSKPVELDDNDLYGAIQSQREFLTESGEFSSDEAKAIDENAAKKRGIKYYRSTLDLLANKFATEFNNANQGYLRNEKGQYITADGKPLEFTPGPNSFKRCDADGKANPNGGFYLKADGTAISITEYEKQVDAIPELELNGAGKPVEYNLKDNGGATVTCYKQKDGKMIPKTDYDQMKAAIPTLQKPGDKFIPTDTTVMSQDLKEFLDQNGVKMGCNLFSNRGDRDDGEGITAANISISDTWSRGPQIVSSFIKPEHLDGIASTDNTNIQHMIFLFDKKMDYLPNTLVTDAAGVPMLNGTFQDMWINIGATLGGDMEVTTTLLKNCETSVVDLDQQRDSVSSVDLNDEAMNLMQYSKSYNAACRLMTTLDSVLDKLINGTGTTT